MCVAYPQVANNTSATMAVSWAEPAAVVVAQVLRADRPARGREGMVRGAARFTRLASRDIWQDRLEEVPRIWFLHVKSCKMASCRVGVGVRSSQRSGTRPNRPKAPLPSHQRNERMGRGISAQLRPCGAYLYLAYTINSLSFAISMFAGTAWYCMSMDIFVLHDVVDEKKQRDAKARS